MPIPEQFLLEANPKALQQNAPLQRRVCQAILTGWQPLLGPITRNKKGLLHQWAAFGAPRLARLLLPLAEWAERLSQPKQFRGWDRERPAEILVRPAFKDIQELTNLELDVLEGEVPRGMKGHLFFQSFAQEVIHELRFMSHPILMRVDIEDQPNTPVKLKVTSRKIYTPQHVFKQASEGSEDRFRFLRSLLWISTSAGMQGDHGTGIVAVDDGLLMTANTSNPVVVDKKQLKVTSPFGNADDYYSAMPFAGPFPPRYMAAHGFYDDNTNEYFGVNYGYGFTRVVRWKPGWKKVKSHLLINESGRPLHITQSAHQLMVCRDYVIVFNNDGHLLDFPNPFCQDTRVFLVPRVKMTDAEEAVPSKVIELPMTASHTIANYDCPDGIITFFTAGTVAFAPDMSGILPNDVTELSGKYYSDLYWGTFPISQSDIGHMGRYTIDAKTGSLIDFKKVSDPSLTWDAQYANTKGGMGIRQTTSSPGTWDKFYATFFGFKKSSVIKRMNDIFKTTKYTQFHWDELPDQPIPGAIVAVDTETWKIVDSYSFDLNDQPGHACNVPGSDGRNWFVIPVQNGSSDRFFIFDPDQLSNGPVCILKSSVQLPYVQHPTWVESLETKQPIFEADLEHDLLVEGAIPSASRIVREAVLPHFKASS